MPRKAPSRSKSPTGWWVATILERFEFDDEDKSNLQRRCQAWSNVVVLKARNSSHAYQKAMRYGRLGKDGSDCVDTRTRRKGRWVFEGLASLLPIYDKFDEDGSEILFDDYENISVGRVKRWVRRKADLEAFEDSESQQ